MYLPNNAYFFSRENNILFANYSDGLKEPLYRFKQSFINVLILNPESLDYMKRYGEMFPDLVEKIIPEPKENEQLTLF